jgi:hypothetical protein
LNKLKNNVTIFFMTENLNQDDLILTLVTSVPERCTPCFRSLKVVRDVAKYMITESLEEDFARRIIKQTIDEHCPLGSAAPRKEFRGEADCRYNDGQPASQVIAKVLDFRRKD